MGPISPILFALVTEGITALVEDAVQTNKLSGLTIGKNIPPISILLYADDTLVFSQAHTRDAWSIKKVFATYQTASGQQINTNKSKSSSVLKLVWV